MRFYLTPIIVALVLVSQLNSASIKRQEGLVDLQQENLDNVQAELIIDPAFAKDPLVSTGIEKFESSNKVINKIGGVLNDFFNAEGVQSSEEKLENEEPKKQEASQELGQELVELNEPEVESNGLVSFVKEKLGDLWSSETEETEERQEDEHMEVSPERQDFEESENGKTRPDYFDPILGDGGPYPEDEDEEEDDCDDEYERTREGDEDYENSHVYSSLGNAELEATDTDLETEQDVSSRSDPVVVPLELLSHDPAEAIAFPKVRLFEAASKAIFETAQRRDTSDAESVGPMTRPSFLLLLVAVAVYFLFV